MNELLRYLKESEGKYEICPMEGDWFEPEQIGDRHLAIPLTPVSRCLLTSDGSMTLMLEALTLSKISMVIERQEFVNLEEFDIDTLDSNDNPTALAREAWLTSERIPLVYAHSLLFAGNEDRDFLQSIQEVKKPLGRMLRDEGIKTLRDSCRIGRVKSDDIARRLGVPSGTDFWSRYYRLATDSRLFGIIFELFSPELFDI